MTLAFKYPWRQGQVLSTVEGRYIFVQEMEEIKGESHQIHNL